MPESPLVTFRAFGPVAEELEKRLDNRPLGNVAKRDLERYYYALTQELASLDLTEGEARLICDALNGTLFEPWSVSLLWASIDDAIRMDALHEKWNVDGQRLVTLLRSASYTQCLAVVDAVERFWSSSYKQEGDIGDKLRAVGLVKQALAGQKEE